jgi:autotransporter-associated beta strand protein
MHKLLRGFLRSSLNRLAPARLAIALGCALVGNVSASAQTTWTGAGSNALWSNPANWTAGVPASNNNPTFMSDVIMLGPGKTTNTADFWPYTLNTLQFPSGAPSFLIHIKNVTLTGPGITNASGVLQTLEVDAGRDQGASLGFGNSTFGASVAGSIQINNDGSTVTGGGGFSGGSTTFFQTSSADQATINNIAAQASDAGAGTTNFRGNSTAGNATINNLAGGASGFNGGLTFFHDSSSAGSATIVNFAAPSNGDIASGIRGETRFDDSSHAGNATIINQGSSAFLPVFSAGFTNFTSLSSAENATITNNPGQTQAGLTQFDSGATAAKATINNNGGDSISVNGGLTSFLSSASAANATINNNAASAASSASGGATKFFGGTAGNAAINNNGGVASSQGGQTQFLSDATAGNATIINNGGGIGFGQGGKTIFSGTSSAGAATLIANAGAPSVDGGGIIIVGGFGGSIFFNESSSGGTSHVEVFGNGGVDISGHASPGVTIGSLEGDGAASLGANNLTIGSNNRSTAFSGVAQDGGASGGVGGSLTKIGAGTLTLSGANTYTGATTVSAGKLVVDGSIAASSAVTVNAGATLGGHGSVGNIGGAGTVSPGNSPGILTASQVNPTGGMSFSFDFTKPGSPTYSDAASSGNSVLHLTGATPFVMALTSANEITVDFSGASLAAGELFRGGFFTDTSTLTSMVSGADFLYTGTGGFTVNFDGFVTEPLAAFAGGDVVNGTVLEFDISGTGTGGAVPEPSTWVMMLLGFVGLGFAFKQSRRKASMI